MDALHQKYEKLKEILRGYGKVTIAFSSGVDSTFLLHVAFDTLGADNVAAATATDESFPERELNESEDYCKQLGVKQYVFDSNELNVPGYAENPINRCYLCKKNLFVTMQKLADEHGLGEICEGSNMDDLGDYRPGLQAIQELGIHSPLREAELYKQDIRDLSKELGLPTWRKQSFACLASRFPYGDRITAEKLKMVDLAEQRLLDLGFTNVRVRVHGNVARIEVRPDEMQRLVEPTTASEVDTYLKEIGFTYVAVDLAGYHTGSMNATLKGVKQ